MPYTVTRLRVGDFPKWRRAFEDHAETRGEAGSRGGHIFRVDGEPDEVVVFLAWQRMEDARDYLTSEAMEEEREVGRVEGEIETLFLEEMGRPKR